MKTIRTTAIRTDSARSRIQATGLKPAADFSSGIPCFYYKPRLSQQRPELGKRHRALLQGGVVEFLQPERRSLNVLIFLAYAQPTPPAHEITRQLRRR